MTECDPIGDFFLCQDSELGVILRKKVLGSGFFGGWDLSKNSHRHFFHPFALVVCVCGGRPPSSIRFLARRLLAAAVDLRKILTSEIYILWRSIGDEGMSLAWSHGELARPGVTRQLVDDEIF